jgi:glutathione S-transferase
MILHQMQDSGNCYKIRLAAHQLGLKLELRHYPLPHAGETRKPAFLAKNPNGRVPLLEFEDGRCLAESDAILWYLTNGTKLQPADDWSRAQALQWMFFEQYSHEPYIAVARYWLRLAPKEALEQKRAFIPDWHTRGNAALSVMETHLTHNDWFAGGAYSLADIALYGYTHCADEGGFELSRYGAVTAWLKRVAAQPRHVRLDESW